MTQMYTKKRYIKIEIKFIYQRPIKMCCWKKLKFKRFLSIGENIKISSKITTLKQNL